MRWFGFSQGKNWAHKAVKNAVYLQFDFKGALLLQQKKYYKSNYSPKAGIQFLSTPLQVPAKILFLKTSSQEILTPKSPKSLISNPKRSSHLTTHPDPNPQITCTWHEHLL